MGVHACMFMQDAYSKKQPALEVTGIIRWGSLVLESKRHSTGNSLWEIPQGWQVTLPRNAEGETVPLLLETMTLIPVSTKGTEKSTTSERSSLMVSEPTAMTALW